MTTVYILTCVLFAVYFFLNLFKNQGIKKALIISIVCGGLLPAVLLLGVLVSIINIVAAKTPGTDTDGVEIDHETINDIISKSFKNENHGE